MTKSAWNCGFGHIYWGNPEWKTSFFVQYLDSEVQYKLSFTVLQIILNLSEEEILKLHWHKTENIGWFLRFFSKISERWDKYFY